MLGAICPNQRGPVIRWVWGGPCLKEKRAGKKEWDQAMIVKVCLLWARLQNISGKKEEVKREKLACASALGQGVVLYNCPGRCYLLLAQGTFCVFSQEVCRYYYLILMFCQLSFQKVRSFSRREGNFGLWLSVSLQNIPLFYIIDGAFSLWPYGRWSICLRLHDVHPQTAPDMVGFEGRVCVLGYTRCLYTQHSRIRVGPWVMDSW